MPADPAHRIGKAIAAILRAVVPAVRPRGKYAVGAQRRGQRLWRLCAPVASLAQPAREKHVRDTEALRVQALYQTPFDK
jgi:hypothetical protein